MYKNIDILDDLPTGWKAQSECQKCQLPSKWTEVLETIEMSRIKTVITETIIKMQEMATVKEIKAIITEIIITILICERAKKK